MPPKTSLAKGFEEKIGPDGQKTYLCRPCTTIYNEEKIFTRKSYIPRHEKSTEHVVAMERQHTDFLRSMETELATESIPTQAINPERLPLVQKIPRRPEIPITNEEASDNFNDFDDVFFNAGQDALERFTAPREISEAHSHLLDKYGNEADDIDITVNSVVDQMDRQDLEDVLEADDAEDILASAPVSSDYFPYRSKIEFLLDMLDSLPRLRLSDAQMRTIIFVLKEAGVKDVPSLKTVRRVQKKLRERVGFTTVRHVSNRGHIFYVNDIHAQISKDFANPLIREHLHLYPQRSKIVSEAHQADKWAKELDADHQTPMVVGSDKQHYYLNELARLKDGKYVIPFSWYYAGKTLTGDCWPVDIVNSQFVVNRNQKIEVPVDHFTHSYPVLQDNQQIITFSDNDNDLAAKMPNPWRVKAKGRPVYCVQLNLWQDDVSGNVSKQWNKHYMLCMTLAGIPKKLLFQEYFTHFVTCSPNASALELAKAFIEAVKSSKDGIVSFDTLNGEEVLLFLGFFKDLGDNPMVAEVCSHIGLRGNRFCPRCKIGGDKEFKLSDEGYHSLFMENAAPMRDALETKAEALEQLRMGLKGENISKRQTLTGVKDSVVMQSLAGPDFSSPDELLPPLIDDSDVEDGDDELVKLTSDNIEQLPEEDLINPFSTLDVKEFRKHHDCPVEILHTAYLGVYKYSWSLTVTAIDKAGKMDTFRARLQSIDVNGLNIDPIRAEYFINYKGGLIGRQFKAIVQTIAFTLHGLLDNTYIQLWVAAGHLASLLGFTEIKDMPDYCEELRSHLNIFLDALMTVDPSKIVSKAKCHIITHIVDDIRRFGPAVTLSTETFESFNGVFRLCSVLSNRHAPSRDIALHMADMARFKHVASGGKWREEWGWTSAGDSVRRFLRVNAHLQDLLGWRNAKADQTGFIHRPARGQGKQSKTLEIPWSETLAAGAIPLYAKQPENVETLLAIKCLSCICRTQDKVKPGSFVSLNDENGDNVHAGRVDEILETQPINVRDRCVYLTIRKFDTGSRHAHLCMPTLHKTDEESYLLANVEHIQLVLNVQHDCMRGLCETNVTSYEKQERENTNRGVLTVQHTNDSHYIVNMHSLHQPHLLRSLFKRETYVLTEDADRASLHAKMAYRCRVDASEKTATASKRKANDATQTNKRTTKATEKQTGSNQQTAGQSYSTISNPQVSNPQVTLPPGSLPPGWQVYWNSDGRPYYFNSTTGYTTWDAPTAMNVEQQQ